MLRDVGLWQVCAASFILGSGFLPDDHTFLPDYETLQEWYIYVLSKQNFILKG